MKFACCYIVLNEEEYIKYSLRSIYNFASQIIIIHGSTQFASLTNDEGLSIDKTKDEISEFMSFEDIEGKVQYHEVGRVHSKVELRNAYIEKVDPSIDWVFVVDGDEIYTKKNLQRIVRVIEENPEVVHIFFRWLWFWGDMQHICVYNEDFIKQSPDYDKYMKFRDKNGRLCRQGEYHERLYRNGLGFKHRASHSVVTDEQGRDVYIDQHYEQKRIALDEALMHHYGYIKPRKKLFEKFNYYHLRDGAANPFDTKPEYFRYLEGGEINNNVKSIVEFNGEHPECMEGHRYMGKNVNQL